MQEENVASWWQLISIDSGPGSYIQAHPLQLVLPLGICVHFAVLVDTVCQCVASSTGPLLPSETGLRVGLHHCGKVCVMLLLSTGCTEGMPAYVASATAGQRRRLSLALHMAELVVGLSLWSLVWEA